MHDIIRGIIPVAPTIFTDDERLDLDGQRRVVDYLVDGECDAICVLANYSEQFSLDDDERVRVVDATLEQAAGRIPVMVTTSHYSAEVAHRRTLAAQRSGASLVMLMPPFFGTTMRVDDDDAVVEYFLRVADGVEIDIMIQDAPMSGTLLSAALVARIAAEVPRVRYAKIEMPRTAQKLRVLAGLAGDELPGLYDGEESVTLIPDLLAGAQGTMSSCVVPDRLGRIVRTFLEGDRDAATADWEDLLPLIHFENRQCGLVAAKYLMREGGIIGSDRTRAPFGGIPAQTGRELIELARRKDALVLRWAH